MSGQNKWTVVGGGKKGGGQHSNKEDKTTGKKIGGLIESTGAFAVYSSLNADGEPTEPSPSSKEGAPSKASSGGSKGVPSSSSSEGGQSGTSKKKTGTRKPKTQPPKINFDERVRELDPKRLHEFTEDAYNKYPDNQQNLLREVAANLQVLFADVEPEREFAFSNRTPGYPLSTLSDSCQEPLLSTITACPPLAQEAVFRFCLDQLLNEVKGGLPSYGTRIMLQLLIQCTPSTCTECTQRIKILLQSSLSKVPEALSLLWVGLPHPQLHLPPALEAWPELCLPLLYSTPNVPRQVLNFAVDYTCTLLRQLDTGGERGLLQALPPATLCALLASPQLTSRKTQTNVQEMINLLQTTLLACCSDEEVAKYFTAVFKRLTEDKPPQVAVSFAMECLFKSVSSVKVWGKLFPSLPLSSYLILKELSGKEKLPSDLPFHELFSTLTKIVGRGSPEERTLAQGLLIQHKSSFAASKRKSGGAMREQTDRETEGGWCSVCGVLMIVLGAVYLYLLIMVLIDVARNGPSFYLQTIQRYVPIDGTTLSASVQTMWRALTAFVQFLKEMMV